MNAHREVVLVHSSDIHLGTDSAYDPSGPPGRVRVLRRVLSAAAAANADVVVLVGDTFDNNRQAAQLIERAIRTMGEFGRPIVILPGNHDPLTPDSVYRRANLSLAPNVSVLGFTTDEAVGFPGLDLEVWGRAHLDYADMRPLQTPRSRSTRWQLAAAHGHYVDEPEKPGELLGSWLICRKDLTATGADYIALGHWNQSIRVGGPQVNAYYSGSPDYCGTVNVVRFQTDDSVEVTLVPLPV
jgi:DNA repair exonuclease SbcCD nuclease subunit